MIESDNFMRAITNLSVVALIAALSPAQAEDRFSTGFDINSVRLLEGGPATDELLRRGQGNARLDLLLSAAAALRIDASVDARYPLDLLTPDEANAFRAVVPRGDDQARRLWTYFFQGTVIDIGHAKSETPLVGFYHPVTDVWLMTLWRFERSRPRLVRVAPVTGEALRGSSDLHGVPAWLRTAGQPIVAGLIRNHRKTIARFREKFPPHSSDAPDWDFPSEQEIVLARLQLFGSTLASLSQDPPYWARLNELRSAIRDGRADDVTALLEGSAIQPVQRLTELPSSIRKSLRPVGHFAHLIGSTIVLSSPLDSGLFIFADFALRPREEERPDLTNFLIVDIRSNE